MTSTRRSGFPASSRSRAGIYPSMYRGRLWTMRQFAGFGTAEETNERFRYLLEHGQTGLSTAFDMPSLMGYDSDHPRSEGEVGREGVAVDTVLDMETLFDGIPLDEVTVSMTINAPAAIMLAFYVVAAERQGSDPSGSAARSRPTSSRSTSPRRSGASRSTRRCGWSPTWSSGARSTCPAGTRSASPATTSARPDRRPPRSSRSRSRTASPTSSTRSPAASTSTSSRRG